jgi:RNA polymerase sigma factor (sigma-70 family)
VPPKGSVTHWLDLLKAGDSAAAQPLWERYFPALVNLARKIMSGAPGTSGREEDAALSAFDSFYRHAEQGRFPRLDDRNNLWRLLAVITARKALHILRDEVRRNEIPLQPDLFVSREPDPALAAELAEECRRLLQLLDDELRQIALWKMEAFTAKEIAARLDCSPRTVERRLTEIRQTWEKEMPS